MFDSRVRGSGRRLIVSKAHKSAAATVPHSASGWSGSVEQLAAVGRGSHLMRSPKFSDVTDSAPV